MFKTSKRIVECECDKCGKEIKMKYIDYNKKSTEDGQIFCEDCEPYYIDNGNNKKFSGIYKIENLLTLTILMLVILILFVKKIKEYLQKQNLNTLIYLIGMFQISSQCVICFITVKN